MTRSGRPTEEERRAFAKELRQLIRDLGMSNSDFALCVGVSPDALRGWTDGRHMPRDRERLWWRVKRVFGYEMGSLWER